MGEPVKAEQTAAHFATVASPTLAATPFGRRAVPTVPAVSLMLSMNVARATYGNSAPLFLLKSEAVDPAKGVKFKPAEGFTDNPVEGSLATAHGHTGVLNGPMFPGGTAPGAINTGVLSGPQADCSAEFTGLLNAMAERLASEFRAAPLQFMAQFDHASRTKTAELLGERAKQAGGVLRRAYNWTVDKTSRGIEYLLEGDIRGDVGRAYNWAVDSTSQAFEYVLDGQLLDDLNAGAQWAMDAARSAHDFISNLSWEDLVEACKEWLMELLGEAGCSLRDLLGEMLADERPMAVQLGEMQGTMKAVAVEAGVIIVVDAFVTRGAASAATRVGALAGGAGARAASLGEKVAGRVNANRATRSADTPGPATAPSAPTPPPATASAAAGRSPSTAAARRDSVEGNRRGAAATACRSCP